MEITREKFLKLFGLAGMGAMFGTLKTGKSTPFQKPYNQRFNMHGYAAPKLDVVRMGFIGIGDPGSGNVIRYASIEGVEVKALCDTVPQSVSSTIESGLHSKEEFDSGVEKYTPKITRLFNEKVNQSVSRPTLRGYSRVTPSDWRLIDCLRNGLPIEIDVYDGALWSVITLLTEWSVARE